jgi:hypothetical protein
MSLALATSCEKEGMNSDKAQYASVLDVTNDGTSTVISHNMQMALVETAGLTDADLTSLTKMKEEEKLARDVYSALYQKWGSEVFARISSAENNHLNAIVRLLQNYDLPDTLIGEAGAFINADIQKLYTDLTTKGSESVVDAYKTGALIEEMDLKDLGNEISAGVNENIVMVYENLERGSRNHLRSFYSQLTSLGAVYSPIYISQTNYDQIVTSAMEKGKQYKMKGQGKSNGKGKHNGSGKGKGK